MTNLRCVSGDKSLFRQWHQTFITALGQYDQVHEAIVQHLVTETDLGKDLDKVVEDFRITNLSVSQETLGTLFWTRRTTRPRTSSTWSTKEMESLHFEFCAAGSPTCRA